MSITKLNVDILVQAAVYGPMGAEGWTPLTEDADELGRQLLSPGRRAPGSRSSDYSFTPLPIGLTALEIVQACRFFSYNRSRCPAIVTRIRERAEGHLAGIDEAPWNWTESDVDARRGRPAPGSDLPAPPPAEVEAVTQELERLGMENVSSSSVVAETSTLSLGESSGFHGSADGVFLVPVPQGTMVTSVRVLVAATQDAAERAFTALVSNTVWRSTTGNIVTEVRRTGNLVIAARVRDEDQAAGLNTVLDQLGPADEVWNTVEPPSWTGEVELVDGETPMRLQEGAVATNEAELERLLDLLPDGPVKDRVRDVDLSQQVVLAAPGVRAASVSGISIVRSTAPNARHRLRFSEDLALPYEAIERTPLDIGSIVLLTRPRKLPTMMRAYATQPTIPYYRRFVGAWVRRIGAPPTA